MHCIQRVINVVKKMISYLRRNLKPTLAYCQYVGVKSPGVLFLPGFMSDMNGTKAISLEKWCRYMFSLST